MLKSKTVILLTCGGDYFSMTHYPKKQLSLFHFQKLSWCTMSDLDITKNDTLVEIQH